MGRRPRRFRPSVLEQFFKILQIMSADENTRIFAHPDIDFGDFGIAVGGRIGFVEQCHGFDSAFANVQNQRRKRVCIDIRRQTSASAFSIIAKISGSANPRFRACSV